MSIQAPIQGIPRARSVFVWNQTGSANSNTFYSVADASSSVGSTTESAVDGVILNFNIMITRFTVAVTTNSKSNDATIAIRDDGADVSRLTISAGSTSDKDSGALSVIVAAGSKLTWNRDTSASASGTLAFAAMVEYVVL